MILKNFKTQKFSERLNSIRKTRLETFFFLIWQSLYDTQIKVNPGKRIPFVNWWSVAWDFTERFHLKGYENISHWSRSSQRLRDARSLIIVSIFLSSLQSIITSRNKILVYFTEIQKLTAYIATATSLIPGLNIRNCQHSQVYCTGQCLILSVSNFQNLHFKKISAHQSLVPAVDWSHVHRY